MGWRAVWFSLRSEARRRWRAWVGLALIVGFALGAAMALAQAARRSQHAYLRFADRQSAADVVMAGRSSFGLVGSVDLSAVARSQYVAASAPAFVAIPFSGRTDAGRMLDAVDVLPVVSADQQLGSTVERWKMLAGRPAVSSRIGEVTASFVLAEQLGLHVGSRLDLRFYRADTFSATALKLLGNLAPRISARDRVGQEPADYADGPTVHFTVVGIEASPAEFPPVLTDLAPVLHLTPAFARRYDSQIVGSPLSYLRLRSPAVLPAFELQVEQMAGGQPVSFIATRANQSAKVQRSVRAEALALAIVAGLFGLAGAVAIGQALIRQTLAESSQLATARALGMRGSQLRAITLARVLIIAGSGALLAAGLTIVGSQYLLLPLSRKADLHPGAHIDGPVLAVGIASMLVFAVVIALWAARLAAREGRASDVRRGRARRRGALTEVGAIGVVPLSMTLGVRFALQRAWRAIPAWATIVATGLTLALLVGALTFTANLRRLLDEPHRYGWNWDVKIGAPGLPDFSGFVVPTLRRDHDVTALSVGAVSQVLVGRTRVDVFALDRVKGDALPTIVTGHAPARADEIALGARSMRSVGTAVGRTVDARIGERSVRLRVVGQVVLPEFGDAGELGTGSLMTRAGLDRLLPGAPANTILVRFGGVRDQTVEGQRLARALEPIPVHFQARPEDLVELARGGGLLIVLVALLSILFVTMLIHALTTSVRARRNEFGVLRALGLSEGEIRATVVWQAPTLGACSLVFGALLGTILGRRAWLVFAHQLGVAMDATMVPGRLFAIVGLGGLALAALAAAVPAMLAARIRPTRMLHTE